MEKQITNEEITPAIVCVRILTDSGSLGYFTPLVFFFVFKHAILILNPI